MSRAVGFVIGESEDVKRLLNPPVVRDGISERGVVAISMEHPDDVVGSDRPGMDRPDDPQHVGPVPDLSRLTPPRAAVLNGLVVRTATALSVLGETAHIWETQLCRDVGGSPRGYVPGIRKEPAEGANRAELYGVPQAVGVTPSPINVTSVLVVKEEVAQELSLFDLADVVTVRGGLVVVKEVYRHPAKWYRTPDRPLFPNPRLRQGPSPRVRGKLS